MDKETIIKEQQAPQEPIKQPKIKPLIIFPFFGYENNKQCEWYFWWTVDRCRSIDPKPLVVITRETMIRQNAISFLKDKRFDSLEVLQTWSVDSCQTWLAGWGHILDHYPDVERIVQIPGDIDFVEEDIWFYNNLSSFLHAENTDIIIGDFKTGDQYSAKSLVDTYGTYSLLANWFPEVSRALKSLPLNRVRSEFINIKTSVLRDLLINNRNFAYEQTLNFLIKSWNFELSQWKYSLSTALLGTLSDSKSFRNYRSCVDQIERLERMLSLLWREIKQPQKLSDMNDIEFEKEYITYSNEYDTLTLKSSGVINTARTTLRALLGV